MEKENVSATPDQIVERATKELEAIAQAQVVFSTASLIGGAIGAIVGGPYGLLVAAGAGSAGIIVGRERLFKRRTLLREMLSTYGAEINPKVREKAERVLTQDTGSARASER
jgi:outer membrane lipoprotein SlyB